MLISKPSLCLEIVLRLTFVWTSTRDRLEWKDDNSKFVSPKTTASINTPRWRRCCSSNGSVKVPQGSFSMIMASQKCIGSSAINSNWILNLTVDGDILGFSTPSTAAHSGLGSFDIFTLLQRDLRWWSSVSLSILPTSNSFSPVLLHQSISCSVFLLQRPFHS